ncbi:MAG TPA: hypothetical protein VKS82_10950 [Streptosporangiaceae bacterium]|nr:hypothetical protein [Streptosporangiaceae bacterium]
MTPIRIRTLRFAVAAALLAGITAFQMPAGAVPAATHSAVSQPIAVAALTGAKALTLSNGTRAVLAVPRAAAGVTGRARSFMPAGLNGTCVYGYVPTPGQRGLPVQPGAQKYTLTIKGRNLAGAPDTGDFVQVFSATSLKWDENTLGLVWVFRHGLTTLHVPAGKYWLTALFGHRHNLRVDKPAQVTVTGNTTAAVSARAASSEVTATTPRRAVLADATFSSADTLRGGYTFWDCGTFGSTRLWVSPLARSRTTGTLYSATSAQLDSPPGQAVPYTYELDSDAPTGTIASQHLTVTAADLATVREHFYSDTATAAPWLALGGPARQLRTAGSFAISTALPMPGDRIVYFQAQPAAVWSPDIFGPLAQRAQVWQVFHAGQTLSANWNAYPLHPAPNLPPGGFAVPTLVSASRAGNKLVLDLTPFSDNTPGHTGSGPSQFNGITGSGNWVIYANGVKIASGKVNTSPIPFADVYASATLSPKPSQVKFTLTTSRQAPGSDLSGTSEDTWTWPSQPEPHAFMSAPWYCDTTFPHGWPVFDHHCAVQDMMTLDYQLAREGLDGSAPAGPQSLGITINHLPTATPYPVTHARLQVAFGNGTSWQPTTLARICHGKVCTNSYRASYTAPAGAQVSLRLTARDTHGATLTETILGAYQTA